LDTTSYIRVLHVAVVQGTGDLTKLVLLCTQCNHSFSINSETEKASVPES